MNERSKDILKVETRERVQSHIELHKHSAAPPPPAIFRSTPVGSAARFTWSIVDSPLCTCYNIYRGQYENAPHIAERVMVIPQAADTSVGFLTWDDPFPQAKQQWYWVTAVNAAGIESPKVACKTEFSGGDSTCPLDILDADTVTIDCKLANYFRITFALARANRTINLINGSCGQKIILECVQSAGGNNTVTWGAMVGFGTDIPSATLTTVANKRDFVGFIYSLQTDKYYVVAFVRGY